jgi:hypothetical protein
MALGSAQPKTKMSNRYMRSKDGRCIWLIVMPRSCAGRIEIPGVSTSCSPRVHFLEQYLTTALNSLARSAWVHARNSEFFLLHALIPFPPDLNSCIRVFPEVSKNFLFYATRSFIAVFRRVFQLSLSWSTTIRLSRPLPISVKAILMWPSHLRHCIKWRV